MLPEDYRPYIDKYFLRSKEILQKDNLDPIVKYQIFIREAPCAVYGIDESIALIKKYAPTAKIWALGEGKTAGSCETIMLIEDKVQNIIDLETMYLGVISAETTLKNDNKDIDLEKIEKNMRTIAEMAYPRPVMYFGARHWRYDRDAEISKACFDGGASDCSTDIGAATVGRKGVGTTPHALEAVYHWKYGIGRAVTEATRAFDKYISKEVLRIALVDYANREVRDTVSVYESLRKNLYGIRIDTCGENYMEGIMPLPEDPKGVSVKGVYSVKKRLEDSGMNIKIFLTSGFGNPEKVKDFINAEAELKTRLFDGLGGGQMFYSRAATADIYEVEGEQIHKVGRPMRPNARLRQV